MLAVQVLFPFRHPMSQVAHDVSMRSVGVIDEGKLVQPSNGTVAVHEAQYALLQMHIASLMVISPARYLR